MLGRQYRLKESRRIQEIRRTGQSWRNGWMALSKLPARQQESRFAFSVSKRIGNAIHRNRIKRQIREAVRQYLPCVCGGWDVVIIARPRVRGCKYAQIQRAVADLLQKSCLWTGPAPSSTALDGD